MAKKAIKIYLRSAIESGFEFIKRRFNDIGELNENFQAQRKWIFEELEKKVDFKQRLAKVLEVLKMHSCKFVGISFLTENRLCEAYEALHGEPISKRSVGSYVKQLKEIGFVTTMPTKREDGKQTANIVIIERFETAGAAKSGDLLVSRADDCKDRKDASPDRGVERSENVAHKDEENLRTKKTTSSLKSTIKELRERIPSARRLLNFVPKWFKEQIACYSKDAKGIYEFWKVTKHLTKSAFGSSIGADELQGVVRAAVRTFYLSAKAAARGKFRMHNPFGFFHTVLEAEGHAHIRRKVHASSSVLYNWIED